MRKEARENNAESSPSFFYRLIVQLRVLRDFIPDFTKHNGITHQKIRLKKKPLFFLLTSVQFGAAVSQKSQLNQKNRKHAKKSASLG